MDKFFGIVTLIGVLIFLAGFISLFHSGLGFSHLMSAEGWSKFQEAAISGGMLLSLLAGTIAYIFLRKK